MMTKIKDELFLGFSAALGANLITSGINYTLYLLNYIPFTKWHLAASLFVPKTLVKTLPATIIGMTADFTVAIFLGVLLTYILKYTGYDYGFLKGLSFGLLAWVVGIGLLVGTSSKLLQVTQPFHQLTLLLDHALFGIIATWLIIRLGEKIRE